MRTMPQRRDCVARHGQYETFLKLAVWMGTLAIIFVLDGSKRLEAFLLCLQFRGAAQRFLEDSGSKNKSVVLARGIVPTLLSCFLLDSGSLAPN